MKIKQKRKANPQEPKSLFLCIGPGEREVERPGKVEAKRKLARRGRYKVESGEELILCFVSFDYLSSILQRKLFFHFLARPPTLRSEIQKFH